MTSLDWYRLRERLVVGHAAGWRDAFENFFKQRLQLRYLHPIEVLQSELHSQGEGFSICAIQCSLIEFLESTAEGKSYKYLQKGEILGEYEYSSSRQVFINFLTNREPFRQLFNAATALDFYQSVRCGLLHEARTRNGWRIWAENYDGSFADTTRKILYRNGFQRALLEYIATYGRNIDGDPDLQSAFIRKFDSLCEP